MNIREMIVTACDWYLARFPVEEPRTVVRRRRGSRKTTPSQPKPPPTYDMWRAYKRGMGERVVAPRGMGREWADRYYCERKLATAQRHRDSIGPRKQLRAGCKRDRRDRAMRRDKTGAWDESIELMRAIIDGYHDDYQGMYWQGARDMIDEAYGTAQYKLYLVRGNA